MGKNVAMLICKEKYGMCKLECTSGMKSGLYGGTYGT